MKVIFFSEILFDINLIWGFSSVLRGSCFTSFKCSFMVSFLAILFSRELSKVLKSTIFQNFCGWQFPNKWFTLTWPELPQSLEMESFAAIVNGIKLSTIVAKLSILDVLGVPATLKAKSGVCVNSHFKLLKVKN